MLWPWPLEKIPAATWPRFSANWQAFLTARARSSAVRAAVAGGNGERHGTSVYQASAESGDPSADAKPGTGNVNSRAQSIFIDPVCRDPSGAAVNGRSDGDHQSLLGNVLVDGVVRKSRQRLDRFVDVDFRLQKRRALSPVAKPWRQSGVVRARAVTPLWRAALRIVDS